MKNNCSFYSLAVFGVRLATLRYWFACSHKQGWKTGPPDSQWLDRLYLSPSHWILSKRPNVLLWFATNSFLTFNYDYVIGNDMKIKKYESGLDHILLYRIRNILIVTLFFRNYFPCSNMAEFWFIILEISCTFRKKEEEQNTVIFVFHFDYVIIKG